MSDKVTLVTGGCRSGKSRHALSLALAHPGPRVYIATAESTDREMEERISHHRLERGDAFLTREAPYELAAPIREQTGATVMLIDCLTVWLGNLFYRHGTEVTSFPEKKSFLEALKSPPCPLVIVTNEVGAGLVPESALGRRFRDEAGWLNQEVARIADKVVFVVSGIPWALKESS